jgi:hypothetical protein
MASLTISFSSTFGTTRSSESESNNSSRGQIVAEGWMEMRSSNSLATMGATRRSVATMKAVQTVRPDKVVFFLGFSGDGGLEEEEDFELLVDFGKATTSSEPFWLSFFSSVL